MNMKIWNEIIKNKAVCNCEERGEAKEFVNLAFENGYKWMKSYKHKTYWQRYNANTCYEVTTGGFMYFSHKNYYKNEGYKIYTYKELMEDSTYGYSFNDIKKEYRLIQQQSVTWDEFLKSDKKVRIECDSMLTKKELII